MQRFKALTSSTREGLGGEDCNTAFLRWDHFIGLCIFDHDLRVIGLTKVPFVLQWRLDPDKSTRDLISPACAPLYFVLDMKHMSFLGFWGQINMEIVLKKEKREGLIENSF